MSDAPEHSQTEDFVAQHSPLVHAYALPPGAVYGPTNEPEGQLGFGTVQEVDDLGQGGAGTIAGGPAPHTVREHQIVLACKEAADTQLAMATARHRAELVETESEGRIVLARMAAESQIQAIEAEGRATLAARREHLATSLTLTETQGQLQVAQATLQTTEATHALVAAKARAEGGLEGLQLGLQLGEQKGTLLGHAQGFVEGTQAATSAAGPSASMSPPRSAGEAEMEDESERIATDLMREEQLKRLTALDRDFDKKMREIERLQRTLETQRLQSQDEMRRLRTELEAMQANFIAESTKLEQRRQEAARALEVELADLRTRGFARVHREVETERLRLLAEAAQARNAVQAVADEAGTQASVDSGVVGAPPGPEGPPLLPPALPVVAPVEEERPAQAVADEVGTQASVDSGVGGAAPGPEGPPFLPPALPVEDERPAPRVSTAARAPSVARAACARPSVALPASGRAGIPESTRRPVQSRPAPEDVTSTDWRAKAKELEAAVRRLEAQVRSLQASAAQRPQPPAPSTLVQDRVIAAANRALLAHGQPGNAAFAAPSRQDRAVPNTATPRSELCATATFVARGPCGQPAQPQVLVRTLRTSGLELIIGRQDARARGYACFRWWVGATRSHPLGQAMDLHVEFVSRGARGAFLKDAIAQLTRERGRRPPVTNHWCLDRVDDYMDSEDLAYRRRYGSREALQALKAREVERAKAAGARDAWTAWRGRHLILFVRLSARGSSYVVEHTLQPRGLASARRGGDRL